MRSNLRVLLAVLFALNCPALALARGNKERNATPVFEDQTNRTEFTSINVGTTTAQQLNFPAAYRGVRDDRHLRIQNNSLTNSLHITTWTMKIADVSYLSSTVTANAFIIIPVSYLDLSPKTTYYGIYDTGASSQGVRVQVDYHDPAGVQPNELQ